MKDITVKVNFENKDELVRLIKEATEAASVLENKLDEICNFKIDCSTDSSIKEEQVVSVNQDRAKKGTVLMGEAISNLNLEDSILIKKIVPENVMNKVAGQIIKTAKDEKLTFGVLKEAMNRVEEYFINNSVL